jgi:hypothetical protein
MVTVYQIINTENGKLYIGQTSQGLSRYLQIQGWRSQNSHQYKKPVFYAAIRKHGIEKFRILPIVSVMSPADANLWEKIFIESCQAQNRDFGYNMADGGGGRPGLPAWNKGKEMDGSFRRKTSIAQKKRFSLMPAPAKGTVRTQEQKNKISQTLKNRGIAPSADARRTGTLASNLRTKEQRAEAARKSWVTRRSAENV